MGVTLKRLNNVLKENTFDEKPFKSTYLFSNWKDLVGVMTQRKRKKETEIVLRGDRIWSARAQHMKL